MTKPFAGGGAPVARAKAKGAAGGYKVTRADGKTAWAARGAFDAALFSPELRHADAVTPAADGAQHIRRYWGDDGMWVEYQVPGAGSVYVYGPNVAAALAYA
mgnify:CR=1 FL=1